MSPRTWRPNFWRTTGWTDAPRNRTGVVSRLWSTLVITHRVTGSPMKSKYRSMTFTKTVVRDSEAVMVPQTCPADLPRVSRARIGLIDVDNIVIGHDGLIQPDRARAALAEIYAQMSTVELSLAVVSDPARMALGPEPVL